MTKATNQHLAELAQEMDRCRRDPVHFCRRWLGITTLWEKQVEIIEALRDHRKVAVASAHECGKTWLASAVAIWFFQCHWPSIVVTTAPGGRQTESLLWANIRSMKAQAPLDLPGRVTASGWKLDEDPRSFMIGFSTSADRAHEHASKFTGFHSEHLLLVFDEAGGIDRAVWSAAEGLMTSGNCKHLVIGNPTDPTGEFARAYRSPDWYSIQIDALEMDHVRRGVEHPFLVSPKWVDEMRRKYGGTRRCSSQRCGGGFRMLPETP